MNDLVIEYHYNLDDTWTWKLVRDRAVLIIATAPTIEEASREANKVKSIATKAVPRIRDLLWP